MPGSRDISASYREQTAPRDADSVGRGEVELFLNERLHRLAKYEVAATLQCADNCQDDYNAPDNVIRHIII